MIQSQLDNFVKFETVQFVAVRRDCNVTDTVNAMCNKVKESARVKYKSFISAAVTAQSNKHFPLPLPTL